MPDIASAAESSPPDLSLLDQLWEWMEQPSPAVHGQDESAPTPSAAEDSHDAGRAETEREGDTSEPGSLDDGESTTPPVADRVEVSADQQGAAGAVPEPAALLEAPITVVRIAKIEIGAPQRPRVERQRREARPLEWAGPSLADHLESGS